MPCPCLAPRRICQNPEHGGKALELVHAVQDALQDSAATVVSLGLDALRTLCADDFVDFWGAWRVVAELHPAPPGGGRGIAAAMWVALLGEGALDVEAWPDKAPPVLEALWAATGAEDEQVWHQRGQ